MSGHKKGTQLFFHPEFDVVSIADLVRLAEQAGLGGGREAVDHCHSALSRTQRSGKRTNSRLC